LLAPGGCNEKNGPEAADETSTGADGSTSLLPTATATTPATATMAMESSEAGAPPNDDDSSDGAECSMFEQDCPTGEKCVPWSDQPDLTPDDIRCCPIIGDEPKAAGDECTVQGYFGSCEDDCEAGTFCLDPFGEGKGVCQQLCAGSPDNPICEPDQKCFVYFAGVSMCFDKCNPLVQACPPGQGCYPDENAAGGTGFICLPTIAGEGTFLELCWLLSGCAPGFICGSPDFLPGCNGVVGCCTPLCDITEPDTCSEFHPDLECISWYYQGDDPPNAMLQDVGACVLPPN
jgi:hypothetical protein